jgi:hypothetical protein
MVRSVIILVAALLAISSGNAADLSAGQAKEAHKIYIGKCAKCHELYDPKSYSDADWDMWMLKMKKKSRLKDEQYELLKSYTGTLRESSTAVKK